MSEIENFQEDNKFLHLETELKAAMETRLKVMEDKIKNIQEQLPTDDMTVIVFSGDMDRMMAAFILASGAAAMGINVTMFFTFWGLTALKKGVHYRGKTLPEKMLTLMMPSGPSHANLSNFHMLGAGKKFLGVLMKKKNIQSLSDCIEMAQSLGVRMVACQMSMDLMGIKPEEFLDTVEFAGSVACLENTSHSKINFFI